MRLKRHWIAATMALATTPAMGQPFTSELEDMDLPTRGTRGNSYVLVMDRDGDEVALLAQDGPAARRQWW